MFSVVVCVHNGEPWLAEQLEALSRQDFADDWELLVVDDRSTDGSARTAEAWRTRLPLRVVPVTSGRGLANARNIGALTAVGEYLLFCDADDVADERWLGEMAAASSSADLIGGHMEEALLNDESIRSWRMAFTPGSLPIAFGRWPCPAGANFGMRASLLTSLGGFTAELATGEEADVGIRAHLAGHPTVYVPDAVIHYRHRAGLRPLARQAYRYGLGNVVLFERHRSAGLKETSYPAIAATVARVAKGVPGAIVDGRRRGAWIRYVAYLAGQMVACVRLRVRWIG